MWEKKDGGGKEERKNNPIRRDEKAKARRQRERGMGVDKA